MSQDLSQRYSEYVNELFVREDETLRYVRQQTAAHGIPQISLEPNEAKLLQTLVKLCGARRVVEVGTLAGYSGICIARALPEQGMLITIEVSSVHAEVARAHFEYAGIADKVTVLQARQSMCCQSWPRTDLTILCLLMPTKATIITIWPGRPITCALAGRWLQTTPSGVAPSSTHKPRTTTPWLRSIERWRHIHNSTAPSSKSAMASPSA